MRPVLLASMIAAVACTSPPRLAKVEIATPRDLAFIDDDFSGALASAKSAGKPLFVDVWAPWCHTCMSLRAYVLRDPIFVKRFAGRFVFASIDGERDQNAAFLAAHPIEAWPTVMVFDPRTGAPLLRWLGAATVDELTMLLDDTEALFHGTTTSVAASTAFLEASRLVAEGKRTEARARLEKALEVKGGPRRAVSVDLLVSILQKDDPKACVTVASRELPELPAGTSRANVAIAGLACADETKADASAFVAAARELAEGKAILLADDRSGVFEALVEHYEKAGAAAEVRATALKWATFLEGEASRAPDPRARAVFDAHRMLAYLALGEPARALPMLEESERDLPSDYNPPARLAKVHFVMGKLDLAKAAVGRALSRAYGPRRLRLLELAADIAAARGDKAAERAALDQGIAEGDAQKPTGGYANVLERLRARRAAL